MEQATDAELAQELDKRRTRLHAEHKVKQGIEVMVREYQVRPSPPPSSGRPG
jgi:hypothetical protein